MSQLQVSGEAKIRDIQGPVVANDGVITALDGAANQYVRGDGTLASFPTSSGGGSSVSYYLNGSVNQGTFGGSTYYQMSKNAIVGTGTNFSTSANGLIAQFITDANDPDVVSIPSGNWNIEFFMSVSASSGSLASFYVEIYKYDGSTFTLLATNSATPEQLTNTTTVDAYFTSVAMPLSAMSVTDRLAVRIYANVASKTVTLYTEDNRLCQIVTTFSKGILSLNNLTDQSQYITTGTSGTDFNIVSSGDTHTFNIPSASASNRGLITTGTQTIGGSKTFNNTAIFQGSTEFEFGVLLKDGAVASKAGYFSISSLNSTTLTLLSSAGRTANLILPSSTQSYTFPNATGTLALTSDLSSYVPYTGATTNVNIGNNLFTSSNIRVDGDNTSNFGYLGFKQFSGGSNGFNGYTSVFAQSTNYLGFSYSQGAGSSKTALFASDLISSNTTRIYSLPNADGTIALTSQIPTNPVGGTGTTNTLPKFTAASTIGNSNIIDSGTLITLGSNSYVNGSLGIGATSLTGYSLHVGKTIGGSVGAFGFAGIWQDGVVQSTTSNVFGIINSARTLAATYTVPNYYHFFADQYTLGAGSSITNQYGYWADSTLTSATNNYGFYGNIPSGTNRWNLYMNGTANNYMAGALGIGGTIINTNTLLQINGSASTSTLLQMSGNSNQNQIAQVNNANTGTSAQASYQLSINAGIASLNVYSSTFATAEFQASALLSSGTMSGGLILNTSASAAIRFRTNATETMRLTSSGRLLIGSTTDSGEKLQVTGTGKFTGLITAGGNIKSQVANYPQIIFEETTTSTNSLIFYDNVSATKQLAFRVNSAANVMTLTSAGAATFSSSVTAAGVTIGDSDVRSSSNVLTLGGTSEVVRITGGNVGIGTSSPNSAGVDRALTISGTSNSILEVNYGSTRGAYLYSNSINTVLSSVQSVPLVFKTADAERMRISSGGNLEMSSASDITFGGSGKGIFLSRSGLGPRASLTTRTNTNWVDIANSSDWSGATICASGGNTLIGTTTDNGLGKLQVNGTIYSGNITPNEIYPNADNTYYCGNSVRRWAAVYAVNGTIQTSDRNLKTNIETCTLGLDYVMKLNPVSYNWKTGDTKKHYGLIAQEVKQLEDSVGVNVSNEQYGLNYSELIAPLIKAIQEQQKMIDELKQIINNK